MGTKRGERFVGCARKLPTMYQHLLVPVDGSRLAEAAMPAVRCLTETLGCTVTLLHMVERSAPRAVHGQAHLATADDAERYLAELARRTLPSGATVQCHVHTSKIEDVAGSIIAHAQELQIDLVVLCTHGASGVRHALFGTVAQRVIALGTTPVMLVPTSPSDEVRGFSCRRLLVPLDGMADHEQGLAAVANIAPGSGVHVLLLMVIPTWHDLTQSQLISSRLLPGTTVELLEATSGPAEAYLRQKAAAVQSAGHHVTTRVVRGEPVSAIVAVAQEFQADVIVLGTHGKANLDAFWSDSVTPRLARKSHLPLLLVPVHGNVPARHRGE